MVILQLFVRLGLFPDVEADTNLTLESSLVHPHPTRIRDCTCFAGLLCSLRTSGICLQMTGSIFLPSASALSGRSSLIDVAGPHWYVFSSSSWFCLFLVSILPCQSYTIWSLGCITPLGCIACANIACTRNVKLRKDGLMNRLFKFGISGANHVRSSNAFREACNVRLETSYLTSTLRFNRHACNIR